MIAVFLIALVSVSAASAAAKDWTWVSGPSDNNGLRSNGTQGQFGATNTPGGRFWSATATDSSGNLWLFGGDYSDPSLTLGDLWEWNGSQWAWISGPPSGTNQAGSYGQLNVVAPTNMPPARGEASAWVDSSGNFWLFGGCDDSGHALNDVWKWDGANWTWIAGSSTPNASGLYNGAPGYTGPAYIPGARCGQSLTKAPDGTVWMFGGVGYDSQGIRGFLSDIWEFDGQNWGWMGGSNLADTPAIYGSLQFPETANVPPGRAHAAIWPNSPHGVWVFGGFAGPTPSPANNLNDMWVFDGSRWAWYAGAKTHDQPATYGTKGVSASANTPGARDSMAYWTDASGHQWLLGGFGPNGSPSSLAWWNDLWKWNGFAWAWMGGANTANQPGVYGSQGVGSASNYPGARYGEASWTDSSGNFWLFGSFGYFNHSGTPTQGLLSDVWKFEPPLPQGSIDPDFDFGNVLINQVTGYKTFTFTNTGSVELQVKYPSFAGYDFPSGDYTCATRTVLQPQETCYFKIKYTPREQGLETGYAQIVSDASNSPAQVDFTGYGVTSSPANTLPDLVVNAITGPTSSVKAHTSQLYHIQVANIGDTDWDSYTNATVYYSDHQLAGGPLHPSDFNPLPAGVGEFGVTGIPALTAYGATQDDIAAGTFPNEGVYWLYAVADSPNYVQESAGAPNRADNPAGEDNNVSAPLQVTVDSSSADLTTRITVDSTAHATGDRAVYTVQVQNLGPAPTMASPSVSLTTDIQSLVTGASPKLALRNGLGDPPVASSGTFNTTTGIWTIGPLASGATATLSIPVTVLATGTNLKVALHITAYSLLDASVTDPVANNNPMACIAVAGVDDCKTGTFVVNGVDLSLAKAVDNTSPLEGSAHPFTYTLTATNRSSTTSAPNTHIYDVLPPGETFIPSGAGSQTSTSCALFVGTLPADAQSALSSILVSGQTIIDCSLNTVVTNGTATAKITVYANSGTAGQTLRNSAYVTSAGTDSAPSNNALLNVASATVQAIDIQVTESALPSLVPTSPATPFTWTITVTNLGPNTATTVVIRDVIPVASLSAPPTPSVPVGTTWTAPNWTIASLPKNASVQMTITATAKSSLTNGSTIVNTAQFLSADQSDVSSANNSASSTVVVDSANEADLGVVSSVAPATGLTGDLVTYTFTVTNNGPRSATNVVLSDTALSAAATVSGASWFNYNGGVPPSGWDPVAGQWSPFSLAAGSASTFTMTLRANGSSSTPVFNNDAAVTSSLADPNSANNHSSAPFTYTGPRASLTPATNPFGNVLVGQSSSPATFTLKNTGSADLHVGTLTKTGSDEFTLGSNSCSGSPTLAPNATCTFAITFSPTATGAASGGVSIASDAPDQPSSVTFDGTGIQPAASLTPATNPFGSVLVGQSSDPVTFTLRNTGTAPLHVGTFTKTGSTAFSVTNNTCSGTPTLAPNATCALDITFSPTATATVSGGVSIGSDAPGQPSTVSFDGTGIQPAASLTPASNPFGNVLVGQSSGPVTFTLKNTGTAPLHVGTVAKSGSTAFAVSNNTCSGTPTLAPNATCAFDITFSPTATGAVSGGVSIGSDAPAQPSTVSFDGTGIQPAASLTPATNPFGDVLVGQSSSPVTFTLTNTGTAPLHVGTFTKSGSAEFTLDNNTCSGTPTLAPNDTCTFDLTFSPTATGHVSGGVSIGSDAPGQPSTASFDGTGVQPGANLLPGAHDFGPLAQGATSAPFAFTLTNAGGATLNISSISAIGDFTVSGGDCGPTPFSMSAGDSCSISVTFKPTAAGQRSGTLSVSSDGPTNPVTADLKGTGLNKLAPPALRTPKNGAIVTRPTVKLVWKTIKGALGYHVQLDQDSGFSAPRQADPTRSNVSFTLSRFGVYFWRVATKDALGLSVYQSPFHFEYTLNKTPKNGAALKTGLVHFKWAALKGKKYILQVYTDDTDESTRTGSARFTTSPQSRTAYAVPKGSALPRGIYYWRVSIDGGATWTNGWWFKVQ